MGVSLKTEAFRWRTKPVIPGHNKPKLWFSVAPVAHHHVMVHALILIPIFFLTWTKRVKCFSGWRDLGDIKKNGEPHNISTLPCVHVAHLFFVKSSHVDEQESHHWQCREGRLLRLMMLLLVLPPKSDYFLMLIGRSVPVPSHRRSTPSGTPYPDICPLCKHTQMHFNTQQDTRSK